MVYTRRRILSASGAVIGGPVIASRNTIGAPPSCYESREYDYPTPIAPDEPSNDAVVSEAYGKLALSSDRPFWVWPVCSYSNPVTIEYEVRPTEDADTPSILVMNDTGLQKYKTKIRDHPVVEWPEFSTKTENLGWFGTWTVPTVDDWGAVHLSNIPKQGESQQSWDEDMPAVKTNSLQCLNSSLSGPVRERHTIEPGGYYVVFDWTDNVLDNPDQDQGTAHVSLRAMHPVEDEVTTAGPDSVQRLYEQVDGQSLPMVDTAVRLAEAICTRVPSAFQQVSVADLNDTAPRAAQLTSTVKIILGILEDRLGYETAVIQRLSEQTAAWTRWGMSVLPVASSIEQLLDDACDVANAQPSEVTEHVENMLMSLGILIADLVAAYYGVAGRAAAFATRMAHKYLLGFVARALGLRTYLVLLRELYTITLGGIRAALDRIKDLTRAIADEYRFITDDEAKTVRRMDTASLQSLDIGIDIDLFSLNPECST